jgi:hypothetical protein
MRRREKQARVRRWREWRRWGIAAGGLAILALVIAGAVTLTMTLRKGPTGLRAVIVDQLALTDENDDFVTRTKQELKDAGYHVDYVPTQRVTVDFYRALPGKGYKLIILRSHAAEQILKNKDTGAVTTIGDAALFTAEPYSPVEHVDDQYKAILGIGTIPQAPQLGQLFTISPAFMESEARGTFRGSTIVLMGCAGLKTETLARAFVARGASEFISWDDSVTAEHTDKAATALLGHLLSDGLPGAEAVAQTMADVGPDPQFGAKLRAYP